MPRQIAALRTVKCWRGHGDTPRQKVAPSTLKSWLSWLLSGESGVSVKLCNHSEHRHHALLHLLELSVWLAGPAVTP